MEDHRIVRLVSGLRSLNTFVAILVGIGLLGCGVLILYEIVMRQTAIGALGGSDEISGYVMAAFATWGFSYALVERAHIRIDLIQRRLATTGRALLDLLSMALVAATAIVVSVYGLTVLAKTLESGATANTPLETPLWIPQVVWFAGWIWFALMGSLLTLCIVGLLARRRTDIVESIAGNRSELEILEAAE